MARERIQLRGVVAEEECQRDGRERVGVGVVCGACENHVDNRKRYFTRIRCWGCRRSSFLDVDKIARDQRQRENSRIKSAQANIRHSMR